MLMALSMEPLILFRSDGMLCRYPWNLIRYVGDRLHKDKRYKMFCFRARRRRIILPLEVVFVLLEDQRLSELDEFETVYVPYSSSFALQTDLGHHEYIPGRGVLHWICHGANVKLFAPPILDVANKMTKCPEMSIERIQIETFLENNPDIEFLFEDIIR